MRCCVTGTGVQGQELRFDHTEQVIGTPARTRSKPSFSTPFTKRFFICPAPSAIIVASRFDTNLEVSPVVTPDRLVFWDLGGEEELQELWEKYYREVSCQSSQSVDLF